MKKKNHKVKKEEKKAEKTENKASEKVKKEIEQIHFGMTRILRTPHSERYVMVKNGEEVAGLDIHYSFSGQIACTLIIFEEMGLKAEEAPEIVAYIQENIFPEANPEEGNIIFTIVVGNVIGNLTLEAEDEK